MAKPVWKPWHEVAKLREDVRSGELSLATFAADLYQVMMGEAKPVYQEPQEFFALTYPTYNLRELCKEVVLRLAGKNDKAVRQLALPYGGGKTHTLITLYHLVNDPKTLPDLPAVREFKEAFGAEPPRARIAALCFDKLDVEKGMEVRSPEGRTRWLKYPWSVLAYQIAGDEGLKIVVGEDGKERETAPAENLLAQLLKLPRKEGLSVLLLVDEVLMYAREKAGADPVWRSRLANFFQYLTQAVSKADRCAMVASLLASDPKRMDAIGKDIYNDIENVLGRQREETVQPVSKDDVAEVLRRRFFTPDSIRDREAFRPHVVAALKGIAELDEQTKKEGKAAEERFLKSFPFHPDLTDILYAKWTNLERFQKTRGVLRTFALALRDAEKWDEAPLVATNVFLQVADKNGLAEAARELTTVAEFEEYDNRRYDWSGILEEELKKATEIEAEFPALKYREVGQAVVSVFLHSQPIGRQAATRELMVLLGATRPDKIELEKALKRWTEVSWFLDEAAIGDAGAVSQGASTLPKNWRLGFKPNLRQMHSDAMGRVPAELVETRLIDEIARTKGLTAGASAAGAKVHTLPQRPNDIEDDGEFHFAVLTPRAASESGKPNPEAKRFIDETTAADRPRVYRNAVVLVAPSKDGVEIVKNRIREYLGWEEARAMLKDQKIDPIREQTLAMYIETARRAVPEAIQQAYCVVVTVSDKNDVQAFKIAPNGEPLFARIKQDSRSRIQDTAVTAEALLPDGPYNLWRKGETTQWVKTLVGAFAQFAHLPKMLNRGAILDTLVRGCEEGAFVLRLTRPDKSVKTYWREPPDEAALKDPGLEVVLAEAAEITQLGTYLLAPGHLPGLWIGSDITVKQVYDYFSGSRVVKLDKGGYEEPIVIPKAAPSVIDAAVSQAVQYGRLWLTAGPASLLGEEIPAGILTGDAILQAPPEAIPATQLLPANLPEAWKDGSSTALSMAVVLSQKLGKTVPWSTVREALDGAFRARLLERTVDSGTWPCDYSAAASIKLKVPEELPPPIAAQKTKFGVKVAEAELRANELQDLADAVGDITKAAAGHELKFSVRIDLGGEKVPPDTVVNAIDQILIKISDRLKLM
jgi:hypothetical protein